VVSVGCPSHLHRQRLLPARVERSVLSNVLVATSPASEYENYWRGSIRSWLLGRNSLGCPMDRGVLPIKYTKQTLCSRRLLILTRSHCEGLRPITLEGQRELEHTSFIEYHGIATSVPIAPPMTLSTKGSSETTMLWKNPFGTRARTPARRPPGWMTRVFQPIRRYSMR